MQLWTKKLAEKSKRFPLYSQDGKGKSAKVLVKIFNPYGRGTWIITEAERQEDGDWLLFGYCHIFEWEWCYLKLSELENMEIVVFGRRLKLERDLHVSENATVAELIE